ncbi:MAG: PKD domain-containing protein, partial [Bacteroidota bacterium]
MKLLIIYIVTIYILIGSVNAQSTCPTISTVTSSSFVCKGSNFTLSVTAVSPDKSALTYEWYKNNILVGTRSQFIISGFTQTDEAAYYVKVANDCGTATTSSTIQLTLADVPSITAISNAVLCEGASQTIIPIISSNNGGALIYSWTKNAILIPTQTQSTISFSPVTASNNGNYAIAASNSCGISSSFFNVSVKQIPSISVQPVATQALCTNDNLQLSVTATTNGTDIINYQWYKDAVLIPGATSSKYTKSAVTGSDAGNYTVIVQNSCPYSQTSTTSVVTVGDIPLISVQPVSNSLCVGSNAAVFNVTANSNGGGLLNYQWLNAGIPINGATNSIYSITGVKSSDASSSYSVRVSNTCGVSSNTSSVVSLTVNETPSVLIVSDKTTYCTGTSGNINFTSTVSGTGLTYTWYKGQTVVGSNSASLLANYSSSSIDGIYSLKVTNSCGQSTSNNITIQSGALPVITTDLKDSVVCSSSSITMSVIADNKNAGALSYIWTGPGIITNTNQSQYTIPSFTADLNGSYTVSVTNSCGTVASKTVNIAVQTALAISSQPQTAIVCKGGSNTLSVTMSANSNPLKYSWYFNNNSIPNANSANLNLSNITTNNVGSYKVQVSTTCGAIVSNAAEISIYDAPIFSVSPTIIYPLCENGSLSLNGSITSANNGTLAPYTFAWKHNGSSMSGNNISVTGSNTSLAIANVANTDKGVYQIVVTDACGNTQLSNTATVQINAIPTFTLNPSSVNICVTQSALLQSNAQNTNGSNLPITYQWYLNTTPIGSATNNNYNLVSMSPAAQGNYHVIATNQCGSITSADAVVNNISLPNLISVTPDLALCFSSSQTRTLTVNTNTTNGLAPTVVWTTDAGSIQGTNIGTTINIAATATNARYTYTLTNACGVYRDVQNNLPFVTVYSEQAAPVVSDYTKAPNTTFCQYANMPLFVQTLSTAALFEYYTWKLNGNIVQNSTNINSKFYTKNVLAPSDAGNYSVDITNSCGTKSDAAFIPVIINPSPSIDFSVTSTVSQCLGGNVFTFLNTSTNTGGNIKYVWDFGDGAFDNTNVTTASHTYSVIGEQTVVLRGTNDYGCTNLNTHKVYVQSSPSILVQPIGGTVCEGSKFVLSAAVSSSFANSVSYQWYNGQNAISGANLNTYTIVSMSLTDAGSYTLHVANAACNSSVTTTPVNINFLETPRTSFISDPNAIPACLKDATFKFTNTTPVLTGGTATYTWTYSDGSIDNNINSTHQFTSVGNYSVSLQAFNGGCTSTPIVLNNIIINGPPIISNNISTSQAIASGTPSTNLVVTATSNTGNGTPSVINYQWYQSQSSLVGSTANTYNISNMSLANVGDYYVLVSNGCGTVKSNVDHITMVSAPIITTQPIDQQVCIGKSVSLAAAAISGDGSNPMYQWYFQASPSDPQQSIIGATNAIYNIASFSNINVGYYFVAIKNTIGTVNSNIVFISDETAPIINSLATIPSSTNGLCINSDLRFNVQFQSKRSSAYTVTWMQNTTVLNQQTQLQLNLTNLQIANSGNYIVQVSNVCGVANDTIPVTVVNKPVFASSLSPQIKCIGTQLNLTAALVATNNNLPLSFQWIKDGLRYAGLGVQADNSITINNLQLVDSGQYALQVSNVCGLSSTNTVKVLIVQNPVITKQPVSVTACVG